MYLALRLKIVNSRGYGTYNTAQFKKDHKKEAEADEKTLAATEEEQEAPVPLLIHVINILPSIFSFFEMYIKSQKL